MPLGLLALALGLAVGGCMTVSGESRGVRSAIAEPAAAAGDRFAATAQAERTEVSESSAASLQAVGSPEASSPPASAAAEGLRAERALGYISLDESQAFVQAVSTGVREAAAVAGIPLVECDAGWTRTGVRACAAQLSAAGVEGVISLQPFGDLAAEVCATLGDVPTVGIVYEQGPCQVSRLEIDQAESGRLAGAALGELAARRWDCDVRAYVSLGSNVEDAIGGARMEGFRAGYREHCKLPRAKPALTDAQHFITAQTHLGRLLGELRGKPIVVAAVSDDAALGALAAAQGRGRGAHVWAAGQLAEPDARRRIACDERLVASVAQFPERFGEVVVPALAAALDGQPIPPRLEAELQLVTARNVRELFPDTPACDG